ncbi:extracellular solute-binding protein [Candidatus Azambacteria bacterium]|nr:extracellular solute-binding protein [Candidatus Azambacteria bacterium]
MKNLKYYIIGGAVLVIIIIVLIVAGVLPGGKTSKGKVVTLKMWGTDAPAPYQVIANSFREKFPGIKIIYTQKKKETYEKELFDSFLNQKAPDIFMIENTWVPRYLNRLSLAPTDILTFKEFKTRILESAANEFLLGQKIIGIPIYLDTLGMFYNDSLLKSAGFVTPPKNWIEFLTTVQTLTKKDKAFNIEIAGASLGLSENVDNASDILELLMLQTGLEIIDNEGKVAFNKSLKINDQSFEAGANALNFYADFANPVKKNYSWTKNLPNSLQGFIQGKVGMIFGYSFLITELGNLAPKFSFKTSIFPEVKDTNFKINLTKFMAPVVSIYSKNPREAWQFLKYLSEPETNEYYINQFNRPTSLNALYNKQLASASLDLEPFIRQSLTAKNFYQFDNYEIDRLFKEMINQAVDGRNSYSNIINEGATKLDQLMKQ